MFRRRKKVQIFEKLRDFLWPRLGWRRSTSYITHRIKRMPGSPYSIAAGFACGAAVSCTPFFGLHFLLAAMIAWMMRGSIFASIIGTALGNPWTFPLLLVFNYKFGSIILGLPTSEITLASLTLQELWEQSWHYFFPTMVGGFVTSFLVWPIVFFPLRSLIQKYRQQRERMRKEKIERMRRKLQKIREKESFLADEAAKSMTGTDFSETST